MCDITEKNVPTNVIIYHPKTETGKHKLAQRVSGVHADFVNQYIRKITCPYEQKVQLLDAIIAMASSDTPTHPR